MVLNEAIAVVEGIAAFRKCVGARWPLRHLAEVRRQSSTTSQFCRSALAFAEHATVSRQRVGGRRPDHCSAKARWRSPSTSPFLGSASAVVDQINVLPRRDGVRRARHRFSVARWRSSTKSPFLKSVDGRYDRQPSEESFADQRPPAPRPPRRMTLARGHPLPSHHTTKKGDRLRHCRNVNGR